MDWNVLDPLQFERARKLIGALRGDAALLALSDQEMAKAMRVAVTMDGRLVPTVAGLLSFGREEALADHLPTHQAAFQVLAADADVKANDFFRKPLLELAELFEARFDSRVEEKEVQVGMIRLPIPDYSRQAFREALLNALFRRDYRRMGTVHVQWFPDRIEFSSPGGFPEGVTPENILVHEPHPRNPRLYEAAMQRPAHEVRAVLERLVEEGLVEARGERRGRVYHFSARVYRHLGKPEDHTRVHGLDPIRQEAAVLQFATSHGSIRRENVMDLCGLDRSQAYRVLQRLVAVQKLVPKGEKRGRTYHPGPRCSGYPPVSEELWIKHLRTDQVDVVSTGQGGIQEPRLEDYVVSGLVDFDDVSYDSQADLLYDLAGQVVEHLRGYLSEDREIRKVLATHQREIARFVHAQMQDHYWEKATGYTVRISQGFTELKRSAYTASASEPVLDYRQSPADKSNMAKYLFGGFKRCLYAVQKFQSDTERKLCVLLEREAVKWFKPAKGQFQIYYKSGADHLEYQPDFVAETARVIYMLEPKSRTEMASAEVVAKKEAAVSWCKQATDHAKTCSGKPWEYLLVPHDAIAENVTIEWLAERFSN